MDDLFILNIRSCLSDNYIKIPPEIEPQTGDCESPATFIVETMKIRDPVQVNCNPPPQGYHFVMATSFATNPPTDTRGTSYVGYMYPPGIAR
jgi:hypothetical protein